MKRGIAVMLAVLLCIAACCALADDYGKAVIDVPGSYLHLHKNPTSSSESRGRFLTGTRVTLKSEVTNGWVEVKIGRETGYMKAKYLKSGTAAERVEPEFWAGTVRATNYARMRYGPSTEYQFACKVNDGENVTIMGKTDEDWYYVQYKDEKGFISENLVYTRGSFGRDITSDNRQENGLLDVPQYVMPEYTPVPVVRPGATRVPAVRPVGSWQDAYSQYIADVDGENDTYALIYVNDDDVPELVIDTGVNATGCRILTYGNGQVNVLNTRRLGFTYIERGNRLCNSDGSMDSYYDDVYEIRNGRWVCIARGEYFGYLNGWNEILGRYVCRYYRWNGQTTDIAQYMVKLGQVYDTSRAVGVEEGYSKDGILWLIGRMR